MTQLPFPLPPEDIMPRRRLWTVSELNEKVRVVLEGALQEVWVEGEISNFRPAQSGHLYFTLKDSRAQIRCVCFRDQVRGLKFRPEDGLHVTVRGSLGVYAARGEYQIYVESIEPVGLGALQLAFDQLKERLNKDGLFEPARKKPLPAVPRRIGVITSPTGAAIRDILHVLARRFASAHVQLYPVKVQGDGAAREIVEALRYFNIWESVDVLIVARGGGSLEDLWAFNEEIVARAISDSRIPVITGVGHETDFTIADFVADVRAPTPSAAAEMVIRTRQEFEQQIAEAHRCLVRRMQYLLSEWRHHVRDLATHRGFRRSEILIRQRRQQVDEYSTALARNLRRRLDGSRHRLTSARSSVAAFDLRGRARAWRAKLERQSAGLRVALDRAVVVKRRRLNTAQMQFASLDLRGRVAKLRGQLERGTGALAVRIDRILVGKRRRWEGCDLKLRERSPYELLKRGYAIVYDAAGKVVRSVDEVIVGDAIGVRLAQGQIDATVRDKKNVR